MGETRSSTERRFDLFVPPARADLREYAWTAGLLVGLLVVGVPLAAFLTPVSVWNLILVAGAIYLGVLVTTRTEFVGLESALVVLLTFDIGRSIVVYAPSYVALDFMAIDLVAVLLAGVFAYRGRLWLPLGRADWRTLAVVAFCVYVAWTFLAAAFGSGPSTTAAAIFAVEQVRYLLVFWLVATIVRFSNPWTVVYPLVIAVCGHLTVALAQVVNDGGFGLQPLGETLLASRLDTILLGPVSITAGFYAGGFLGFSRELAIVLLVFVPLVVAVATRRHRYAPLALVGIAVAVLLIRVADTDAGWAALFVVAGSLTALYLYVQATERADRTVRAALGIGAIGVLAVGAYLFWRVASAVRASRLEAIPLFSVSSLEPRIDQYTAALDIAVQYPLFGLGGQNFYILSPEYVATPHGIHSLFFSHLAATGFVGVGAYLVSVGALIVVALRRALDSTATNRFLWASIACGMIGFNAYAAWDLTFSWETALLVFWALAGVVVGTRPRIDEWEWATDAAAHE